MKSISQVLLSALPKQLLLHKRIDEIKSRWVEVVGEALAKRTAPVMFEHEDGEVLRLVIEAKTPAAAQKTKLLSRTIIQKLNEIFEIKITDVRVN